MILKVTFNEMSVRYPGSGRIVMERASNASLVSWFLHIVRYAPALIIWARWMRTQTPEAIDESFRSLTREAVLTGHGVCYDTTKKGNPIIRRRIQERDHE